MLTQLEVDAINKAFRDALSSYNSNAREKVVENKATFSTCAQYLKSEDVNQASWTHKNIWSAAILAVHDQLEKVPVKTDAQIAHEKDLRDRQDGSFKSRYRPKKETPAGNLDEMFNKTQENLQRLFNPQAEAAVQEKVQFPPYDKDIQDQSPEMQRLFRSLSAADMKKWMAHRAVVKHRQEHNLDAAQQ